MILITAAASAHAYRLERFLSPDEEVLFADSTDLPEILLKDRKCIKIPAGHVPSFAHLVLTKCLDWQITRVFPLRRSEIIALAEVRQLFDEYQIELMVPSVQHLNLLMDRTLKGELVIQYANHFGNDERGIFVINAEGEKQLYTAD